MKFIATRTVRLSRTISIVETQIIEMHMLGMITTITTVYVLDMPVASEMNQEVIIIL